MMTTGSNQMKYFVPNSASRIARVRRIRNRELIDQFIRTPFAIFSTQRFRV